MSAILFKKHAGTRPDDLIGLRFEILEKNASAEQNPRTMLILTRPVYVPWADRPKLDIIAPCSKNNKAVRVALSTHEIREMVKDVMPSSTDQGHFALACVGRQGGREADTGYLGALAFVLGCEPQNVTRNRVLGRPKDVFEKVVCKLRHYAQSRSWWFGFAPAKPQASSLCLSPELSTMVQKAFERIDDYQMALFERNKGIAIGVAGCGFGVMIVVGSFVFNARAYNNGKFVCEGFAWDVAKKAYIKTKSETWYSTPITQRGTQHGIEAVMPSSPESIRGTNDASGVVWGLIVFVAGTVKIGNAVTTNKWYRDFMRNDLVRKKILCD